jgi:CDP-diacylglycerol--serine O-phosphatidyltransferase
MFNIPNLFTTMNMLSGILAILLALAGRIDIAPYFIFLGAALDFFDGFLARLLKQQGELGKQLDSLADMITFGLAPGIIIAVVLVFQDGHIHYLTESTAFRFMIVGNWLADLPTLQLSGKLPLVALIIPFFSMFRLAKFNIDTRQSESFIGLPTPANTIFFMAFPLLLTRYGNTAGWQHDLILWLIQPAVLIPIIVIMSLLLVAELPLFALKFKGFQWKGNEIRYTFLISCGILIPLLMIWAIPIIVLLYLLFSFVNNTISKKRTHEIQS